MGCAQTSANEVCLLVGLLVCLAGGIGSGKSSVRAAIAAHLGWKHTGFGDYLRNEVERRHGDPSSRQALQDLGQSLVDDNADAFCRRVLESGGFLAGDDFVLDGIRHESIYRVATKLARPSTARLIFLAVPENSRRERVAQREDGSDFVRSESHRVESQLRAGLPALADIVIDGTAPFDEVVKACLGSINHWQSRENSA